MPWEIYRTKVQGLLPVPLEGLTQKKTHNSNARKNTRKADKVVITTIRVFTFSLHRKGLHENTSALVPSTIEGQPQRALEPTRSLVVPAAP